MFWKEKKTTLISLITFPICKMLYLYPCHQLALYVLSFLSPRDLLRAAQTCRYWRVLAEDNLLWREKCREEGVDEEMVYAPYGNRGRRSRGGPTTRSPFKAMYLRQSQIEHNWRKGVKRLPKVLSLFYCFSWFVRLSFCLQSIWNTLVTFFTQETYDHFVKIFIYFWGDVH